MKERPILFSGEMVRALLAGTKTQTRRVVSARHLLGGPPLEYLLDVCPYGRPGDTLWVRESFWEAGDFHSVGDSGDCYQWVGGRRYVYAADGTPPNEPNRHYPDGLRNGAYAAADPHAIWRRFPSIHMPRPASRIALEVTRVRVERLQAMSEADAHAEGVTLIDGHRRRRDGLDYYSEYASLWDRLNFKRGYGWAKNPWVWVVEFKRIQPAGK